MSLDKLIPDKYPQGELFLCDVREATLKDIIQEMEHPFYSLSKKPETNIREYKHNGNVLKITPSIKGLPTIYDKDILVFCISQLMAKKKNGLELDRTVKFSGYDYFNFTNRGTSKKDYLALNDSITRLKGVVIDTNIKTGNKIENKIFGLIESGGFIRTDTGKLKHIEITLSQWVFEAIEANEVLTLHKDYFRLRKPIEKRLYELFRKHCGNQNKWSIRLALLHHKSGTKMTLAKFRWNIKQIIIENHLPDYDLSYSDIDDKVTVYNKSNIVLSKKIKIKLKTETYSKGNILAPSFDVYQLYEEWLEWANNKDGEVHDPDRAFLGFCRSKNESILTG